jgi:hypothetical protein
MGVRKYINFPFALNPIFLTLSRNPFFHQKRISPHVVLRFIKYLMPSSPRAFSLLDLMQVQFNFAAVENHFSGRKRKRKYRNIDSKKRKEDENYFGSHWNAEILNSCEK